MSDLPDAAAVMTCPPTHPDAFGACATGVSITGIVDAIARGWSFDCQGLGRSPDRDKSWSFHVRDGSRAMWVGIVLPWRAPFLDVGDKVSVDYQYGTDNEDGLTPGSMTVRDGDGRLLFWTQLAYATAELALPKELQVRDAPDALECDDGCGLVRRAGFEVQSAGKKVVLGYGERGEVGDYVVFHGRNAQGGEMTGDCSDWFVHVSQLTAVRGSIASLDARDAKPCGGASCNDDQFCAVPTTSTCDSWDPGSACTDAETDCADDCAGVCGCDGRFYCNACKAHAAGTDVAEDTECSKTN